jgi:hypothetical protein
VPHVPDCSPEPIFSIPKPVVYVEAIISSYAAISVHSGVCPGTIIPQTNALPTAVEACTPVTEVDMSTLTLPTAVAAETPVGVTFAAPATVTLPTAVAAETPVTAITTLIVTLPTAVAAETPVGVTFAAPVTVTLPTAVAAETPVTGRELFHAPEFQVPLPQPRTDITQYESKRC